jgi:hypothetical protein
MTHVHYYSDQQAQGGCRTHEQSTLFMRPQNDEHAEYHAEHGKYKLRSEHPLHTHAVITRCGPSHDTPARHSSMSPRQSGFANLACFGPTEHIQSMNRYHGRHCKCGWHLVMRTRVAVSKLKQPGFMIARLIFTISTKKRTAVHSKHFTVKQPSIPQAVASFLAALLVRSHSTPDTYEHSHIFPCNNTGPMSGKGCWSTLNCRPIVFSLRCQNKRFIL